MEIKKIINELEQLKNSRDANDDIHIRADNILLEFIDSIAPEISDKYIELRDKIQFWYS